MAIGQYEKINFNNGATPAINSTNLNKMDSAIDEIDSAIPPLQEDSHTHDNKSLLDGINQDVSSTSSPTFNGVKSSSIGRTDDLDLISMPSVNNVTINGNLSLTGTAKPNGSSYTVRGTNISTSAPTTEGIDGDMWIQV